MSFDEYTRMFLKTQMEDVYPHGIVYNGQINYDNVDCRSYNGFLSFDGNEQYDCIENIRIRYDNQWDIHQFSVTITQKDSNLVDIYYNDIITFNGAYNYSPSTSIEEQIDDTIYRHYLYNGRKTYGIDKAYDGDWGYNGSFNFNGESNYLGIYEIEDTYIPPPDASISGDTFDVSDTYTTHVNLSNLPTDSNIVTWFYNGALDYNEEINYYNIGTETIVDNRLDLTAIRHYLYDGKTYYGKYRSYDGNYGYKGTWLFDGESQFDGLRDLIKPTEDCTISGDSIDCTDISDVKLNLGTISTDINEVRTIYDNLITFDGNVSYDGNTTQSIIDGDLIINTIRHYLYDGKTYYGASKSYLGNFDYDSYINYEPESHYDGLRPL
jgi:YHS domain-containing protein